jgi:hypothetical protein
MEEEERAKRKEPIMSRILKNILALALMVGALIEGIGTSDAQNYRYYNNAYGPGPAYHGAHRSYRATAPYYTNSLNYSREVNRCWQSPGSLEYTGRCY